MIDIEVWSSFLSRLRNYPSHLWFEITLLPQKAPLPEPRVLGRALGVLCHVISGLERWVATRGKADLDNFGDDWSDMRTEMGGIPIPGALEDEPSWSVVSYRRRFRLRLVADDPVLPAMALWVAASSRFHWTRPLDLHDL